MSLTNYEISDGIATIGLNNPPVNALGLALRSSVAERIDQAMADTTVNAIVLIGSERVFSAGADIKEMGQPNALEEPVLPSVLAKMETCGKPIVAAIGGVCMGGGLELAMAAHHRIALKGSRLALPEVKLGLLPGAGGTQRFTRAVGLERALDFILGGEPVAAEIFDGSPLIARVVEQDLLGEAIRFAREVFSERAPLCPLRDRIVDEVDAPQLLTAARSRYQLKSHHTPAPIKIIDSLEAAVTMSFADGLRYERAAFLELRDTSAHRSLRYAFRAERECAKIPDLPNNMSARQVSHVGVIGGGTMGRGIVMNFLNVGVPVTLVETGQAEHDAAVAGIRSLYQVGVDRGRLTPKVLDERMSLLNTSLDFNALSQADFIIEAVFEEMAVKKAVFSELGQVAKAGAILATNTSTLDIDQIAMMSGRPCDVVGTHFFSPANVMKLCEVVRGNKTSNEVLKTAMTVAKRIGKTPVVAGVCDGFIGNRMLEHYVRMAHTMVEEGASPSQVDQALEAWGMAMGPFRVGDLAGNDIGWAIRKRRYVERPHVHYARVADAICKVGRFGQKTSAGWYRYEKGSRVPIVDNEVTKIITKYREQNRISPRVIEDKEIVERCIYALVNEGARILEEGIALRASDIDVVYLTGYGFPRFRGGPMRYADEIGLSKVAEQMMLFESMSDDPFWKVADLISAMIEEEQTFTD